MDAWDKFLENAIADDKERKKKSREHEIHVLDYSDKISKELVSDILRQEREYRELIDDEIKGHRELLLERKEKKKT